MEPCKHQPAVASPMRCVLQRVTGAKVEVDGEVVSQIGRGVVALVGLHESDTEKDSQYIVRKILNLRLWQNESSGKAWDQSVMQREYEVLLVSQFTLYGQPKGNKLDFHVAMPPQQAKAFYDTHVLAHARSLYRPDRVKDGVFGAMMEVDLVNDGPVTLILDSSKGENSSADKG